MAGFFLDQEIYNRDFKNFFRGIKFSPKSIVQFSFQLPFQLPLPDLRGVVHDISRFKKIGITFKTVEIPTAHYYGYHNENPIPMNMYKTIVETNTFSSLSKNQLDITDLFDESLILLNDLIVSYALHSQDLDAIRITKEMLSPMIIYNTISGTNFDKATTNILMLHNKVEYKKEEYNQEKYLRICSFSKNMDKNPFTYSQELYLSSFSQFSKGLYRQATIDMQTSLESFFIILFKELSNESGMPEHEIEKSLSRKEFRYLKYFLENHFMNTLGNDYGDLIEEWNTHTYGLRNKIVHEGYYPTDIEVNRAIECGKNLKEWALDKLKAEKLTFPKCNEYFL